MLRWRLFLVFPFSLTFVIFWLNLQNSNLLILRNSKLFIPFLAFAGLFHRVIQQSGSPLGHWSVSRYETKPNFVYKIFTSSVKCFSNDSTEVKRCIQKLDTSVIQQVITDEFEVKLLFKVLCDLCFKRLS